MGEHDDDLDIVEPARHDDVTRIAAAVASGLERIASALERGLHEIASAIGHIWTARDDRYSELRGSGKAPGHGERRVEMHYIGG